MNDVGLIGVKLGRFCYQFLTTSSQLNLRSNRDLVPTLQDYCQCVSTHDQTQMNVERRTCSAKTRRQITATRKFYLAFANGLWSCKNVYFDENELLILQ